MKSGEPEPTDCSPGVLLFIVSTVQFLMPLMTSSVNIALPVIGREFQAGAMQLGLIQMIYILAASVMFLPAGRYADIHGRKRIFISGTVLAMLSTLAIPLVGNIRFFILFRLFQGVGAAMVTATSFAILTSVFPPSRRGQAMGIIVSAVYVGLAAGPTLSGIIVTHLGWRWIFYLLIPLQASALVLTLTHLRGEWADSRGEPFDWRGSVLFALAISLFIVGLARIDAAAWAWLLIVLGGLGLTLFYQTQKRTAYPLVDVRIFSTNLTFTLNNTATLINYAASFGIIFLFSLYLQYAKGFSPQTAGWIMMTQPLTQSIVSPVAGRLADRFSAARMATLGMVGCTLGLFLASFSRAGTPLGLILFNLVLLGVGFGLFTSPNMSAIMSSVTPKYYGTASSMVATMRTQGMLVSMAVVTVILSLYLGDQSVGEGNMPQFMKSMQVSLRVYSVMGVAGILFSMGKNPFKS